MRRALPAIISTMLIGATALVAPPAHATPSTTFTDLDGLPLSGVTAPGSQVGVGADGEPLIYYVSSGSPAAFSAVDARTGERVFESPMEGAGGSWIVEVADDGTVYTGAYGNGSLFRWKPGDDAIENLGQAVGGETFIWALDIAADGTVYGATGQQGGHFFSYDPDSDTFTDHGPTSDGEATLVRGIAVAPDGDVFGIRGLEPKMHKLDAETGTYEEVPLPEPGELPLKGGYDLDVRGELLFARFSEGPGDLHIMDLDTEEWVQTIPGAHGLRMSEIAEDGRTVYFVKDRELHSYDLETREFEAQGVTGMKDQRAFGLLDLDLEGMEGETVVSSDYEGNVTHFHPATGTSKKFKADPVRAPAPIRSIMEGPDGKVYAGSYLNGRLASYDPETGEKMEFAPEVGQAEGMAMHAGKLYIGTYPGADIWELDTDKPFVSGENPRHVTKLRDEGQSRPYAMVSAGRYLAVGTVPSNGTFGGALTLVDTETGEYHLDEVVSDHSVVGLGYWDGILYGSTSVYGGVGAPAPTEKEGTVFAYDVEQRELLWQVHPAEGQGSFGRPVMDADGELWVHSPQTLLRMDKESGEVLDSRTYENYPWDTVAYVHGGGVLWADPYLDDLSVVNQAAMYVIDDETLDRTRHVRPVSHGFLHSNGKVYLARDLNFYSLEFEDGRGTPEATVTTNEDGTTTLRYEGLGANEPVELWLRNPSEPLGTARADAEGTLEHRFATPEAGTHLLTAFRPLTRGELHVSFDVEAAAVTTVTSAIAGTTVVGRTANAWGTVGTADATVSTQVQLPDGRWARSQTTTADADGKYVIELTYGKYNTGELNWRVVVDHADGTQEIGEVLTQTRIPRLTASSAGTKATGATTYAWGTITSTPDVPVRTQVQLADGRWVTSQRSTTQDSGWYQIELTYGKNTPGTYRWRVVANHPEVGTMISNEFTLTRR